MRGKAAATRESKREERPSQKVRWSRPRTFITLCRCKRVFSILVASNLIVVALRGAVLNGAGSMVDELVELQAEGSH
jgi:hypothetical protein